MKMSIYQSEYEKFQEEMRAKHPEWADGQREGIKLLWDKKVDFAELASYREIGEHKKAYPYDVNF
jgi:hypothetical protein